MNSKEILKKLYTAKTDEEVTSILNSIDGLSWKEYGGSEYNTSIINGQMSDPLRCLVENVVNGIDAIKMLEAKKRGVDLSNPDDPKMPSSSKAAVREYFGIDKPLYQYSSNEKKKLCNVGLYIERLKPSDSSVIIYDYGEGQCPDKFEDTLLSLAKGNKAALKFVQGKYNMGSTGVIKKCNGHRYQLIISMKNLCLEEADKRIGFTVVRQAEDIKKGMKYKSYEYCIIDNAIPYIDYTERMKNFFYGIPNFKGGCIRKLYSYNIGRIGGSSRLPWKLNSLFYDTEVPVKISSPKSETDATIKNSWLIGSINKIKEGNSDTKVLLNKSVDMVLPCGVARIEYFVFSNTAKSGNSAELLYINGHNVSFIDNGQNNGDLPRTFLSNDCNLTQIAKNMIVFVDTSNLPTADAIDIYKPSRDQIDTEAELSKIIIKQLKDILMEDDELTKLNEEFKGKTIYNADAEKLVEEVMQELSENENIRNLLASDNGEVLKRMAGLRKRKKTGESSRNDVHKYEALISLTPSEKKTETIAYGKTGTIEFCLGQADESHLDISESTLISIKAVSLKKKVIKTKTGVKERVIKDAYSKVVEDGKIKLLVNPATMGFYTNESFEINFENLNDAALNAVVEITVTEAERTSTKTIKKDTFEKLSGPQLCLTSKSGSEEGVIAWGELPFAVTEEDVCKIIVSNTTIERVYLNLDSCAYHKILSKSTNMETSKSGYISNVYVQSIVNYLSQASNFAKMFEENLSMNEFKDVIINQLVLGTEMSVKNMIGLTA